MGASNSSTAKPYGSSKDEEPQQPNNNYDNQGRRVWSPPPTGRYKMNTDGGCRPVLIDHSDDHGDGVQRGPSGYGGILRDHQGNWVRGFIGYIGDSDCLTSEFYGILKGLELLDKLKLKGSILETDCQSAYEWITRGGDRPGKSQIIRACWPMIIKCRQLAEKNDVAFNHILRGDANRCADKLADIAIDRKQLYVEIKDVPYELRDLVEKETNSSGESSSIGTVTAIVAGVATVATVAWGISKMLSGDTENQKRNHRETTPSFLNSPNMIPRGITKQRSVWSPPPPYRFKINTDGACRPVLGGGHIIVSGDRVQRGPSGYGGILRDHEGNWVRGFIGFIGESDCLTSELYGILKGLELLDKLELKGSILETDCQSAYEWITREDDHSSKSEIVQACSSVIKSCRNLAKKNNITMELILGDNANRCADKLARMAIDREETYVEIKDVPYGLRDLVEKDANNYSY